MEAHQLFGVLHQLGMDLDTAHKENADRDTKVSVLLLQQEPRRESRSAWPVCMPLFWSCSQS
jgi:hypothetical protein